MFGSTVLDIAIGLVLVYLLLSIFCSALSEAIAARLALRSRGLERAIRRILGDPQGAGLAKEFFSHPLIDAMKQHAPLPDKPTSPLAPVEPPARLPAYIPARTFALTLFDLLVPSGSENPLTLDALRSGIKAAAVASPDGKFADRASVAKALLPLLDQAKNLDDMRAMTETWFDDSMNRLSGWYKRHIQEIVRVIAVCIVVFTNADTLMVIQKLSQNQTLRSAAVQQAIATVQRENSSAKAANDKPARRGPRLTGEDPPEPYGDEYWAEQAAKADPKVRAVKKEIDALNLLGWELDRDPNHTFVQSAWTQLGGSVGGLLQKLLGLFLTVLAVSMGTPFWFDLLNRVVNLRQAGPKPAPPESKDKVNTAADGQAAH
jgi:hypothetical protein